MIDHYKQGAVTIGELMGHESERLLAIATDIQQAGCPANFRRTSGEQMGKDVLELCLQPRDGVIDDQVAKALDHPEMSA